MLQTIKSQLDKDGHAFFPNYAPELDTAAFAEQIGKPMTPWADRLVQDLVPRHNAPPNTYSGIFGLKAFPFHTDLAHWRTPPRYLVLRCLRGYEAIPTPLMDGIEMIEAISLDVLTRAIFKPRRPQDGSIHLMRICDSLEEGYRLRWDQIFLRPASKIGELANQQIRAWLGNTKPILKSLVNRGDTLIIDNWRMLHSRSPIPAGCEERKIERVYVEALH